LIKNFLANGCSFTEHIIHPDSKTCTWATFLSQQLSTENYINLAKAGAGNDYICNSTINYLEHHDLDPDDTLVIVMWSGVSRADMLISDDWYEQLKSVQPSRSDGVSNWISSGGIANHWQQRNEIRPIFESYYKITEPVDHCLKSLRYFIMLESYLKIKGYQFLFTSFINYWGNQRPYYEITNDHVGRPNQVTTDPMIGYHCNQYPMFKKFDFDHWVFVNDQKDTICEFAHRQDPRESWHPSNAMHERFTREILLPRIQQIHV
jgi:hypothetical protein